ncbi:hypothetical protein BGX31_001189 [Mortierella sp. GBA43]|nr:hypothetical protein BGX31_001189 [Mortierella sp. GBA43]
MVFGGIISSPRGNLAHGKLLELAQTYLGIAGKALDPDIALVLCHDTEVSLSRAKKNLGRHLDQTVLHGIATTYIGLGQVLKKLERHDEAKKSFDKAGKLGASRLKIQEANSGLLISFPEHGTSEPSLDGPKDAPVVATNTLVEAHPTRAPEEASVGTMDTPVHAQTPSNDPNQHQDVVTVSQHLFYENSSDLSVMPKLPKPDERLRDTHQLVSCLSLLKASHSLDDLLGTSVREWIRAAEKDDDEQERLKTLSLDVIRTFKREEIKDSKAIAEVTCLAPILDRDTFRDILNVFCDGISQPSLLDDHLLHGLAQLIQGADHDYLEADDLVKILEIIATRLQNTHKQSPQHMFQLTMAASHVLDAMADTNVKELDRKKLHAPLSSYLDSLKGCSEPYLAYQVAYAYQALQCVPDDETLWQASLRRTGKVIRGVSGLVSAVKGLDLNGFVDGLKDIQQGLAGATEVIDVVVTALHDVGSVASSGKDFIDGLKEGFSFKRKCAWYAALRGADALIRSGDFSTLKALVCSAPCRWETTFQWGICQRLGEIASNRTWGSNIRRHAVSFLGEMYKNDKDWRAHPSVKEWIVMILIRLSSSTVGDLRCKYHGNVTGRSVSMSLFLTQT